MSKFIVVLTVFISLQITVSVTQATIAPNCESANCTRCVSALSKEKSQELLEELIEYCTANADRVVADLDQKLILNEVYLRIYNLTDKLNESSRESEEETTPSESPSDPEENLYKSIVVFNKEYNLLPSMHVISQNSADESMLGEPISVYLLGTTRLTEAQFSKYLDELKLDDYKDEEFDKYLNEIVTHLLSN